MVERTLSQSKPLLTGIAALGAAAAVLGLYKMATARPRRRKGWIVPPEKPSMLGNMARAALTSAAASLAGYFMERLQRMLDGRLEPERMDRSDGEAARSAARS